MSMVLMCVTPGLEKSTHSLTSGSMKSLKQSSLDALAFLNSAFNHIVAKITTLNSRQSMRS